MNGKQSVWEVIDVAYLKIIRIRGHRNVQLECVTDARKLVLGQRLHTLLRLRLMLVAI